MMINDKQSPIDCGVFGSSGSIGRAVIDVIDTNSDKFRVKFLSVYSDVKTLINQTKRFFPEIIAVASPDFLNEDHKEKLLFKEEIDAIKKEKKGYNPLIFFGPDYYKKVYENIKFDVVIVSIAGIDGLMPTYLALQNKIEIGLANKETIVAGGDIIMNKAREKGIEIVPIDSEHSAIFDCINGEKNSEIKKIILTASGGPFRSFSINKLKDVTIEDAIKHPTWKMSKKITIDCATMMNKGIEIIETMNLFSVDEDKVKVVIHKESIIHSLVEFKDNSIRAVLSVPDMRIPITRALTVLYEKVKKKKNQEKKGRLINKAESLDLIKIKKLSFSPPDYKKFPCLKIAREVAKEGGILPAVMNSANQIAVYEFLDKKIKFLEISENIIRVIEKIKNKKPKEIEEIIEANDMTKEIYKNV